MRFFNHINVKRFIRPGLTLLCAAMLVLPVRTLWADFRIISGETSISPGSLSVRTRASLELSGEVERALNSGIDLHIVFQLRLYRVRPIIWDDLIGEWNTGYTLKFHALSSGYVLLNERNDKVETFLSIRDAMDSMSGLQLNIPIIAETLPETPYGYRVAMRVFIDNQTLPSPLKLVSEISPEWNLNSSWKQWRVND